MGWAGRAERRQGPGSSEHVSSVWVTRSELRLRGSGGSPQSTRAVSPLPLVSAARGPQRAGAGARTGPLRGRASADGAALNMPANLENSAVATGLEKVRFHSNPKERKCQAMLKLLHNCTHLTC